MEDGARQLLASVDGRTTTHTSSTTSSTSTSAVQQTHKQTHKEVHKEVRWVALSVHRCLLYLGDLARYYYNDAILSMILFFYVFFLHVAVICVGKLFFLRVYCALIHPCRGITNT